MVAQLSVKIRSRSRSILGVHSTPGRCNRGGRWSPVLLAFLSAGPHAARAALKPRVVARAELRKSML
jgi:hypothetical protein